MDLFSDERSISSDFEKKITSINLTYTTDYDGVRKTYPNLSDRIYYALGDSYSASKAFRTLKLFGNEVQPFTDIGFRKRDGPSASSKTAQLRAREVNYKRILGVEPNGLMGLSESQSTHILFDPYIYPNTVSPLNDFIRHALDRWGMILPRSLINIIIDNVSRLNSTGLGQTTKIYHALVPQDISFDAATTGPFVVTDENGELHGHGITFSPLLSKSVENGRLKNLYRSIGLVMTHDYFVLIGESPGTHYKRYKKMRRDNTLFWDPRPSDLPFEDINTFFGLADIDYIVDKCNDAINQGQKPLVLIDIRRDKPDRTTQAGIDLWETQVQEDNELICKLVNALSADVTVCAKMRPAYGNHNMPMLSRPVRMLPLPYLKRTTSEFNMFAPSKVLLNGTERIDWSYDDLTNMGEEVFVLKNVVGALYNRFLCDHHLCLGVINRPELMSDGTSALWSISNADNDIDDIKRFLLTGSNFMIAAPYAKMGTAIVSKVSRNRHYNDHAITAYDEVMLPDGVYVLPLYAIPEKSTITQHDFRNCVITDDVGMFSFSQPSGVVSTQIVKLVSFMMKDVFKDRGLDWTKIDQDIRNETIMELAGNTKVFEVNKRTDGTVTVDGRLVSVSGHMLYIVLGSVMGMPYGIKKYIKEIEHNILHPGQSYERKVGGRVWHGLLSHYLATSCVLKVVDRYMRMEVNLRKELDVVITYIRGKLISLGMKYEVYLHVDESDII